MCYHFIIVNILKGTHKCRILCPTGLLRICEYKFYTYRSHVVMIVLMNRKDALVKQIKAICVCKIDFCLTHISLLFVGHVQTV